MSPARTGAGLAAPRGVSQSSGTSKRKRDQDDRERARQRRALRAATRETSPDTYAGAGGPRDMGPSTTSTSGGGGATRTVPPLASGDVLRPGTAFGQSFDPLSGPTLRANPDALGRAYLSDAGISSSAPGGALASVDDISQFIPLLLDLSQGLGGGISATSDAALMDYTKQVMDEAMTPGGGLPNLAKNIFAAQPGSGLYSVMNDPTLDAAGQAQRLLQYLAAGVGIVDSGPVGHAMYNFARSQASDYIAQQARNLTSGQSFADFLRNTNLDEWLNG